MIDEGAATVMFGILTDDAALARAGLADATYYLAEGVDGTRRKPVPDAINSVACWGDTAAVREHPGRAAVTAEGIRAVPETDGHHWATVCPTDPEYLAALLERLEQVSQVGDVRLTTLGFPGEGFCRCARCREQFTASDHDGWTDWRTDVVTAFVAEAASRVDSRLTATLYPDPYPGHLRERAGLDPQALAPYVDEFLVPLCSIGYETTYWVESLARGFATELEGLESTLSVQLSAPEADVERLTGLSRQVAPHVDRLVYGTHPDDVDVVTETMGRVRDALESADADEGDAGEPLDTGEHAGTETDVARVRG